MIIILFPSSHFGTTSLIFMCAVLLFLPLPLLLLLRFFLLLFVPFDNAIQLYKIKMCLYINVQNAETIAIVCQPKRATDRGRDRPQTNNNQTSAIVYYYFLSLLSSSSVFGDLDNLLLWLVCWLRCSLRFIFRRLHLSLIATTACNNMPKKKPVPSSTLIQHIAKKISSADTLQPRPHFSQIQCVRMCLCVLVLISVQFFSAFRSSFHVSKIA